jgi:UMF1 family MFS transporter
MTTIEGGQWRYALVLFIIANVGVAATLVFYDSLLPHIAASDEFDRVSTAGYAIGFIGGGVLLLINLAWILSPGTFGLSGTVAAIKLSLASVGVWWLLFSIPLFRVVREPVVRSAAAATPLRLGATIRTTWDTFQELRRHRNALWMLVAFLLYNDGIQTIIRMSSIYGAEIGIDRNAQIMAFVMVQFVGVPCSFLFGSIAGRIGPKTALSFTLAVYMGISILGYFLMTAWQFFALAFLVGTVQGPSQALSRSLYARMIPKEKSSECFGFFAVFEKFAGIAGPAVFAGSITLFQSSRAAVLSVLVFFVLGAIALTRVDVAAGESQVAGGSVL